MILQQMIWCDKTDKNAEELYYHVTLPVKDTEGKSSLCVKDNAERGESIEVPAGTKISFDTYFNAFLAEQWKRYTVVQNVRFKLSVEGLGTVFLIGEKKGIISEQKFEGRKEIVFEADLEQSSAYYLQVFAAEKTVIERGVVETEEKFLQEHIAPVHLALVTCTYNRREMLLRNLKLLKQKNVCDTDGVFTLEQIYVIDNAQNLKRDEIEENYENIHLIPNPNTGGTGGFTRGIQEAIKKPEITHILLMDDDVTIEFEAFRRTRALLSCLKSEYAENFVGGAMLRTDIPYMLHAAGEGWEKGHIINPYEKTDLRDFRRVLEIADTSRIRQPYAAWWYCCIPRKQVEEKGIPIPLFLHGDDIEYGLRNGKQPLYLNGIAVWHEEFEDKRSSILEYYDTRNWLILNALDDKTGSKRAAQCILWKRFAAIVFRYRYKDFALIVKAVEDFLKGPEWLYQVDAEEYHRSLQNYGYKMKEVKQRPSVLENLPQNKIMTVIRYFFPARGKAVLRMGAPLYACAGKKKILFVEPKAGKGILVRKSWKETGRCAGKMLRCMWQLQIHEKEMRGRWQKRKEDFTTNCKKTAKQQKTICKTGAQGELR